jgi:hypothetical protein
VPSQQIPASALISLRQRLDLLPPRCLERKLLLDETANLYGISKDTLYTLLFGINGLFFLTLEFLPFCGDFLVSFFFAPLRSIFSASVLRLDPPMLVSSPANLIVV